MNKCKRFFFSFILKGFEDSFEVIGVNPSCFGDAFSEKLRKEERERKRMRDAMLRELLCFYNGNGPDNVF